MKCFNPCHRPSSSAFRLFYFKTVISNCFVSSDGRTWTKHCSVINCVGEPGSVSPWTHLTYDVDHLFSLEQRRYLTNSAFRYTFRRCYAFLLYHPTNNMLALRDIQNMLGLPSDAQLRIPGRVINSLVMLWYGMLNRVCCRMFFPTCRVSLSFVCFFTSLNSFFDPLTDVRTSNHVW